MAIQTIKMVVPTAIQKVVLGMIAILLVSLLCFSVFYLLTDYSSLVNWYLDDGACFYHQSEWRTRFFSPSVKTQGNVFAGFGFLVALVFLFLVGRAWKATATRKELFFVSVNRGDIWMSLLLLLLCIMVSVWEWGLMAPAYDEVFSAVNCAEEPLFRTLTYYMLPNNHIAFNLLNGACFGWYGDMVLSGRLLSVLGYLLTAFSVYWASRMLQLNRYVAFIAVIPVAFQFHTLGFATQARGYELQLLCGWLSSVSLVAYTVNGKKTSLLYTNTLFNTIGFALIPSFLFLYIGQLIFTSVVSFVRRRVDVSYLKCQVVLASAVFLFYLPALCFSGLASFTDNSWVKPMTDSVGDFIPIFTQAFDVFIRDCFSADANAFGRSVSYLLFFLPITFVFSKDRKLKLIGGYFIATWVAFILYSLYIRRISFHRTILIQLSISVFCSVYCVYNLLCRLGARVKGFPGQRVLVVMFSAIVLLYGGYLLVFNRERVDWVLYGYNTNSVYEEQKAGLAKLPEGSSVTFSDDAFYFYYMCRKQHYIVSRCISSDADYLIKIADRPFPNALPAKGYKYFADCGNDFAIYQKLTE